VHSRVERVALRHASDHEPIGHEAERAIIKVARARFDQLGETAVGRGIFARRRDAAAARR